MTTKLTIPADYAMLLADLKRRISSARARAVLAANNEQIALYHDLGKELLARRTSEGWGAKVIDRLAADLSDAFPEMRGFSARNLNTCAISPSTALMAELGSSLLPNCLGSTSSCC